MSNNNALTFLEFGQTLGEPVLFFHGWPGSAKQGVFLDQVANELGLRVIAINRPGICGSRFIPDRNLRNWPEQIEQLAKELKLEKYSIIAVSGGGPYALACAVHDSPLLDKILIVCGAPLMDLVSSPVKLLWVYRLLIGIFRISPKFLSALVDLVGFTWPLKFHLIFFKLISLTLPKKDQEVLRNPKVFKVMLESMEDQIIAGGKVLLTDAQIYLDNPKFKLSDIKRKITWWHGKMDQNIPVEYAREYQKQIPNFDLNETDEDGHFSIAIMELNRIVKILFQQKAEAC